MALMGLATAFGSFITWIAKGAWRARTLQADLEKRGDEKIEALREHSEEQREKMKREFGETCEAVRRNTDNLRVEVLKDFVRRDDFNELRTDIRDLSAKIDRLGLNGTAKR